MATEKGRIHIRSLHPYLRRRREHILQYAGATLVEGDDADTNFLCAAEALYLGEALRSFTVYLDEIARQFLVKARLCIDDAFRRGVRPYIGGNPSGGFYCDDDELNRHWAIAYKVRYKIDVLLKGRGDQSDLSRGMEHLERLWRYTDGLTDHMSIARNDILCDYLWLSICAGACEGAIDRASRHVKVRITSKTRIRSFLQEHAYLRFFLLVARYARGEDDLQRAAREGFLNLFDIHWDIEHSTERAIWAGELYAFEWAWLWECVFEEELSVAHAIEILRGTPEIKAELTSGK